jgi:Helix-turn-helix domain
MWRAQPSCPVTGQACGVGSPEALSMTKATAAEKKARKAHNVRMWTWIKQVNRDRSLPPSKTAVAVVLADRSNYEKPDTWPSIATIAEECGMAESSAVETIQKLIAAGHLNSTPGRRGRGHSTRYRLIVKPRPAEVYVTEKTPGFAPIKPRPAEVNLLSNLSSAASPRTTVHVDKQNAETQDSAPDGALNTVKKAYNKNYRPTPEQDEQSEAIIQRLCSRIPLREILVYVHQAGVDQFTPEHPDPLPDILRELEH